MNAQQIKIGWIMVLMAASAIIAIGAILFTGQVHFWSTAPQVYEPLPSSDPPKSSSESAELASRFGLNSDQVREESLNVPPLGPTYIPGLSGANVSSKGVIYAVATVALAGLLIVGWLFVLAGQAKQKT